MANHSLACQASKDLCDRLFEALNQRIPDLKYNKGGNKCSFKVVNARKVFAWVNSHSQRNSHLNIWFLGKSDQTEGFKALDIRPRNETEGTWADYGGSFRVEDQRQLSEAVELLCSISYPASLS